MFFFGIVLYNNARSLLVTRQFVKSPLLPGRGRIIYRKIRLGYTEEVTMRILIITPLFPPDVTVPASYAKELSTRLLESGHQVTVLLYGHHPEAISGVTYRTVSKQQNILPRLINFTRMLFMLRSQADYFVLLNGPSTELPFALLTPFLKSPAILINNDTDATHNKSFLRRLIRTWILRSGVKHLTPAGAVLVRSEIHPLLPFPTQAREAYNSAWDAHLKSEVLPPS